VSGQGERLARAGLSRCAEPEDLAVEAALGVLGAERLWDIVRGSAASQEERHVVEAALLERGAREASAAAGLATLRERLRGRAAEADPVRDLENVARLGGGLLLPGEEGWPLPLNDLGPGAPVALWWRGARPPVAEPGGWLGVVGTRDPTAYGLHVTSVIAGGAAAAGAVIVSGGALGIDAAAHRAALESGPPAEAGRPLVTACVLAGGVDRLYPASNARLLQHLAREQLLLSEHPPGCAPTRWRFLSRNRLIAALGAGLVVVEGRWRSGSLSTAHRAAELGRWVGAVPGPVTSGTSEGPHRLIREGAAELVVRPEDALGAIGLLRGASPPRQEALPGLAEPSPIDGLSEPEARVFEALPRRGVTSLDRLVLAAGLAAGEALGALHSLLARGRAERRDGGWARTRH
jgi:DNA processing protein